jgi:hypothetical protein
LFNEIYGGLLKVLAAIEQAFLRIGTANYPKVDPTKKFKKPSVEPGLLFKPIAAPGRARTLREC